MFATVNNMKRCAELPYQVVAVDPVNMTKYSADPGDYFMYGDDEFIYADDASAYELILMRVIPEELEDIPEHIA